MKKIVVLGSLGMAGHVLTEYMSAMGEYDIYGVARSPGRFVKHVLDVSDFDQLSLLLNEISPDYVVNCVGVLVNKSINDVCSAIELNSYLPNYLSLLGEKYNYKLIHISTDCVFSGKAGGYKENSFRDGDNNYARTKALGEINNDKDLTIRTSIIGPELKVDGTGLLDWFLKQTGDIAGYANAYWTGITTLELAKSIHEFIKQDICGLYQLCPAEKISKYELLKHFSNVWGKNIQILKDESYRVDKSLISTRTDFDYDVPNYQEMLDDLRVWIDVREDDYKHYKN